MTPKKKDHPKPPAMNPYIFPALLIFFGLWCMYDGWLTADPEMQEHALFNQVLSMVLLPWGVYDLYKTRKKHSKKNEEDDGFQ